MTDIVLVAPDISCDHCKRTIESELAALDGVTAVDVTPPSKTVHVRYDAAVVDEPAIRARLDDIGYPVGD